MGSGVRCHTPLGTPSGKRVVSPTEPGHPSVECTGPDWPPHLSPSQTWWRGPPAFLPNAAGPLSPSMWAPLSPRGRWGIRPGPAQKIKQGRALQLCAAHSRALTPTQPSSRKWMRRARQGEAPEDMAALASPLRWSTLQSIFLSYAHLTPNTEHPGPRAVEEGGGRSV